MIELYSGTPGSGKSLHTADKIRTWVNRWRLPVIANFAINTKLLRNSKYGCFLEVTNEELSPELLILFSQTYKKERGLDVVPEESILCVIDECQLLFNNREWAKPGRKAWMSFFTQHRKYGYRIILVAQFKEMLDKQVRSLIEYEYIHRKVKNIGLGGSIFNIVAGGGLHVSVKLFSPLRSMKVGSEFFKYDKYLAAMYNSYKTFDVYEPLAGSPDHPPDAIASDVVGAPETDVATEGEAEVT